MFEYLILYCLFLFAVISQIYQKQQIAWLLVLYGLIISTFISAFRDMIGGYDIYIYAQYYENIKYKILPYEYGYYLYNVFLHYIDSNRQFLFIITALIFTLGLNKLSKIKNINLSCNVYSIVCFIIFCKLYFYTFVYLRQVLAVLIIWWGLYQLINNKKYLFILAVIFAANFHISALIAMPLFFMKTKMKFNKFIIIYIIGLVFGVIFNMQTLFSFLGGVVENERIQAGQNNAIQSNYFYVGEATLLFLWMMINYKNYIKYDRDKIIIFNISLYYVFLVLITVKDATAVRMAWYFLIGPAWLIAYNIGTKFKGYRVFCLIIICYFSIVFFRTMFLWDGGDFLPYKSIYSDISRHSRWEYLEYR